MDVQAESYGGYKGRNCGAHAMRVRIGRLILWFSYESCVAFATDARMVVRQNEGGPTTARHLNLIDGGDRAHRVVGRQFEAELELAIRESLGGQAR